MAGREGHDEAAAQRGREATSAAGPAPRPTEIGQNRGVTIALHVRMGSSVIGGTDRALALVAGAPGAPDRPLQLAILDDGRTDWNALRDFAEGWPLVLHRVELGSRVGVFGARRLALLAAELGAQILHSWDYKANLYSAVAASLTPLRWVVTLNGTPPRTAALRLYAIVDRCLVRRAAGVFCVSRELASLCGRGVKAQLVPNPVLPTDFAPRTTVRHPRRIVALGRLEQEKGFDVLLEALALARPTVPGLALAVVGDGPLRADLVRRAGREDLAGVVTFSGWSNSPDSFLAEADLFVLPSRSEHQPLALLEAIRAGLPVVATRVGDVPEMVDSASSLLVAPGDAVALAAALVEAAGRSFATGLAAERVLRDHSPSAIAAIYEAEYRRLVGSDALRGTGKDAA